MQPVELPSVAGLFFRILASLALIIILTYFVLYIVKKQQNFRQQQKEWVKIFDYQALGPNRGLYLLELYNAVVIAGVSEGQIAILKEINPDDEEWREMKEKLRQGGNFLPGSAKAVGSFEKQLELELKNQLHKVSGLYRRVVGEERKSGKDQNDQ